MQSNVLNRRRDKKKILSEGEGGVVAESLMIIFLV